MPVGLAMAALLALGAAQPAAKFHVYFFTATWCAPCRAVYPVLEKHKSVKPGCIDVASIDIDTDRDAAARLGVGTVPVVIGTEVQGQAAFRIDGAGQLELKSLDTALAGFVKRCRARK